MSSAVDYPGRVDRPERRHIVAFCNTIRDRIGRENAITASELATLMGIDDSHDTTPRIREVVRYCRRELLMPIGSGASGYYLIATPEEAFKNIKDFEDRIAGYNRSKVAIIEALNQTGFADCEEPYAGVIEIEGLVEEVCDDV